MLRDIIFIINMNHYIILSIRCNTWIIFKNYCLLIFILIQIHNFLLKERKIHLILRVLNIAIRQNDLVTFFNNLSKYDILFFLLLPATRNRGRGNQNDKTSNPILFQTDPIYPVAKDFVPYRNIENLFTPCFAVKQLWHDFFSRQTLANKVSNL